MPAAELQQTLAQIVAGSQHAWCRVGCAQPQLQSLPESPAVVQNADAWMTQAAHTLPA